MQTPFERFLEDAAATEALGGWLATHLRGGVVVTLSGDLGAGKTTLVRGMLRALGVYGPVKSPSYALVEEYLVSKLHFKLNLYHFDFYRIKDPSEWDTGGFSEYFRDDAVCVIEWPEKLGDCLPPVDLAVSLALPARAVSAQAQPQPQPQPLFSLPPGGGGYPEELLIGGAGEEERQSFFPSPPTPLPQGERGAKRDAFSKEIHLNRNCSSVSATGRLARIVSHTKAGKACLSAMMNS
ncbi:MAG: tRNA (adenosine(37)-N6)-threonylcarbamoyltransferase complex ATPase subunit type 1 TsaE [Burkholderiales bacterium]|jgi:tRNA threonylcarbamoyladenosine biosynthesis protein TsaE|nr:tRNA (adenosine(37)-N6)-threonylcarbamoyltransferase complex ATPase subunit type 1 TsaE [Burkholderiales bacterium]